MRYLKASILFYASFFIFFSLGYAEEPDYFRIQPTLKIEPFAGTNYRVLDIRKYKEFPATSTPGLKVVDAGSIFNPGTILFGFGLPNVYLGFVAPEGKFVKFDAKSLYRAPASIVETDGRIQSGVFVVLRNLPDEAVQRMHSIAQRSVGNRNVTCARSNALVLHEAGFTIGGRRVLNSYTFPSKLLRDILSRGLEFEGTPVQLDIVMSSPLSLAQFIAEIQREERLAKTIDRHKRRNIDSVAELEHRRNEARRIREENRSILGRETLQRDEGRRFTIRASDSSAFGRTLHAVLGAHVLYEMDLDSLSDIQVSEFLPNVLKAYPQQRPDFATWVKKRFLFNPLVVKWLRSQMARKYKDFPDVSEVELENMFEPDLPDAPNKFNFVITGNKLIIANLNVLGHRAATWLLSKHVLMANYSTDVRFAGEFWKSNGVIYFNNNSGTYQPSNEGLRRAEQLLSNVFSNLQVRAVKTNLASPTPRGPRI